MKHAAGFKQLVRELGVHGEERRELSDRLQQLVMSGKLVRLDADRFAIPQAAAAKNTLAGRLTMHRDGYGFVIPETSSIPEHLRSQMSGDLFIPPPAVAMGIVCWPRSSQSVPTAVQKGV